MKKKKSDGKTEKKVGLKKIKRVSKKKVTKKKPVMKTVKGVKIEKPQKEKEGKQIFKKIDLKGMFSTRKTKIEKIVRIHSGIKNFNEMIGGGFQKNSTNLVVGGAGSGKTIFAMQFLIEGIKRGEKCLYISFDEKKDFFFANMKELGWDLEDLERKGNFFFLEYTPQKVKVMLEEGGGIIENMVLSKKITRIVIDSITAFLFLFKNEVQEREATLSLINLLSKWDTTTIITYEGDPSRENKTILKTSSRILELESDSIVLFYFLRNKRERGRFFEILKVKGAKHPTDIFSFTIEKGGLNVSKKPFTGDLGL